LDRTRTIDPDRPTVLAREKLAVDVRSRAGHFFDACTASCHLLAKENDRGFPQSSPGLSLLV